VSLLLLAEYQLALPLNDAATVSHVSLGHLTAALGHPEQ
jgi:hypothetical protein